MAGIWQDNRTYFLSPYRLRAAMHSAIDNDGISESCVEHPDGLSLVRPALTQKVRA